MRSRGPWTLVVLGLILALFIMPGGSKAAGTAKVRVVHASPDAPAVDVYVDGNKVLANVAFFNASNYLDVAPGEHRFQVTQTGQPADTAVIDTSATVADGKAYSVIASGRLAAIKATIIDDNLAAPPSGKANIRVLHLSPDTPAADLKVKGGAVLAPGVEFSKASAYLPVNPGPANLVLTPAGSDTLALDLSNQQIEAGKIYDVFVVGFSSGQPSIRAEVRNPQTTTAAPPAQNTTATAPAVTAQPAVTATAGVPTGGTLPLPDTGGTAFPTLVFAVVAALLFCGGLLVRRRMS